jgi:hypothetical protein
MLRMKDRKVGEVVRERRGKSVRRRLWNISVRTAGLRQRKGVDILHGCNDLFISQKDETVH